MKKKLLFFMLFPLLGISQTQVGQKIEAVTAFDAFGESVAMSADGRVIAVGAPFNRDAGVDAGHVRVYQEVSGNWVPVGDVIEAEAEYDQTGHSIALSADGSVLAVAAIYNRTATEVWVGTVRIFKNTGGSWVQIGNSIEGEANLDTNGWSVALSADGNVVAMSAPDNDGNGVDPVWDRGQVRVFENRQGNWTQVGLPLYGLAQRDSFGTSIALSDDGRTVAIGTIQKLSLSNGGYTMVFQNIGGTWTQLGQTIQGGTPYAQSGSSVSLSSDGTVLAVGAAAYRNGNNYLAGMARIFKYSSGSWRKVGNDLIGNEYDSMGYSVSLSSDGNVIAVGAPGSTTLGDSTGKVSIFKNQANVWTPMGIALHGEGAHDSFGKSVALSDTGYRLVAGAPTNFVTGVKKGYVKVYDFSGVLASETFSKTSFLVYPNPASEWLTIELDMEAVLERVVFYNQLGQKVKTTTENTVDVRGLEKGMYFVEILTNQGKTTQKIMIN